MHKISKTKFSKLNEVAGNIRSNEDETATNLLNSHKSPSQNHRFLSIDLGQLLAP